jgi:hypothetical protein
MRRLHLNVTPEFERDLQRLMELRGIKRKSDALRAALREAVIRSNREGASDYRTWLGTGWKSSLNNLRFLSDNDLWS